tara:strand:+ start:1605 stop:1808 length:204 start_codon:yes stop_codon:yes gene_type:complete
MKKSSEYQLKLLKISLLTFSSFICGLSNDIGRAVTMANDRTSIKSVVKWLNPSSDCVRAKLRCSIVF